MSYLDIGKLFSNTKSRMGFTRNKMAEELYIEVSTAWRIETRKSTPQRKTSNAFKNLAPLLDTTLILPYLEDQPMEVFALCDDLTHAIDEGDLILAEELIAALATYSGFDKPINRQFMLSQGARLDLMRDAPSRGILKKIHEGLAISGTEKTNFKDRGLVLQEAELLHSLALVYGRDGDASKAIDIIDGIMESLSHSPIDEATREKRLASKIYTKARLLYMNGDYKGAVKTCNEGFDISVKRNNGKHCADFLLLKAKALYDKGNARDEELYRLLIHSFTGYTALAGYIQAQGVKELAKAKFNIELKLYGMDGLTFKQKTKETYARKDPVEHDKNSGLITSFIDQSGFTRAELCRKLCSTATISRLVNNSDSVFSYYTIDALYNRVGRDVQHYKSFRVSSQIAEDMALRDEIQVLCLQRKYEDAEQLLDKLAKSKDYKNGVPLQYILKTRATIFGNDNRRKKDPKYLEMLLSAIKITCPQFKEEDIRKYPLTLVEATIINQIAIHHEAVGNQVCAAMVYRSLLANIESNWRDETLLAKLFATVSFNYSSCLGMLGQKIQAQEIINKAVDFEQSRNRLTRLPGLFFNTAYGMVTSDVDRDEGLALLALSYYIEEMLSKHGKAKDMKVTQDFVEEHFGFAIH